MPVAQFQDAQIRYQKFGEGSNITMLLPQSSGPAGRQTFLNALAANHRVITYDQRGTGHSSASPGQMSMADQAEDVVNVLDIAGVARTYLFCHSTGCGIGLSFAAVYPDRVSGLILTNPWTHGDAHLTAMQNLRIDIAGALDPVQYARFNAALLFPPEFRRAHERAFEEAARSAAEKPQDADEIARRLQAILAFDARPLWGQIKCPTLLLSAIDDQLMPCWFAKEAAAGIAGAQSIEFNGGGHMLPETRTQEVSEAVTTFVSGVET